MTMRRRWALPVFVIPPRLVRSPLESSRATAPLYPISWRGLVKRESSPPSLPIVAAETSAIPRNAWRASMTARRRGRRFDGLVDRVLKSRNAIGGVLAFVEIVQQGRLLRGLGKMHRLHPRQMRLRPRVHRRDRPLAVAQQELAQAMPRAQLILLRRFARPHQI